LWPESDSDEALDTIAEGLFDRCLALHYPLLGRLTAIALEIEASSSVTPFTRSGSLIRPPENFTAPPIV
jgi:hypothetical protein